MGEGEREGNGTGMLPRGSEPIMCSFEGAYTGSLAFSSQSFDLPQFAQ